jgi:transcriptional regulator
MYQPRQFEVTEQATLHAAMRAHPLGTLVTLQNGELVADEVPFYLDPTPTADHPLGFLKAHVARANPLWQQHDASHKVLVVFKGPQAYVTPSWYATKAEHGKVVPTWNYIVVQASGHLTHKDGDNAWLRAQLDAMTHSQEGQRPAPWAVSDAPADYIAQTMKAIVGIEIPIDTLVGKWKVSQNQPAPNREGVVRGLTDTTLGTPDSVALAVAQAVRDRSPAAT